MSYDQHGYGASGYDGSSASGYDGSSGSGYGTPPGYGGPPPQPPHGPGAAPGPGYGYGYGQAPQQPPGYDPSGYGYPHPHGGRPSTTTAMWTHLGALLTITAGTALCCLGAVLGWIVPLSIRNSERHRHDPFIRHHGTQALNFGITQAIMTVVSIVFYFGTFFAFGLAADEEQRASSGLAIPMLTVIAIIGAYGVTCMVFAVIGLIKASQGQMWSYPKALAWRFSKG
ncbi:DUF4870 domain-containing protein [Streptomyces sp. NPDC003077]|uniref:DUF4870 domain-containing protein n=1 Tax=Streptomyces sp. NPDC003077 TaxID=3154443 RepID=UPI00339ED5CE